MKEEAYHCLHQVHYDGCGLWMTAAVVSHQKRSSSLTCTVMSWPHSCTVTTATALSAFTESVLSLSAGIKIQMRLVVLTIKA